MELERTDKVKIVLGVLLVLIAARLVLNFFPEPLEFAPYATDAPAGELQTMDVVEITFSLGYAPEGEAPRYFYRVRMSDGSEGLLTDTTRYIDEVFPETVTFTGRTYVLPELQNTAANLALSEAELTRYGGNAEEALNALHAMTALDISFRDRTTPHPAAFWVSVATTATFCVMLAMLLKEYFGGKRKRPKGEEE